MYWFQVCYTCVCKNWAWRSEDHGEGTRDEDQVVGLNKDREMMYKRGMHPRRRNAQMHTGASEPEYCHELQNNKERWRSVVVKVRVYFRQNAECGTSQMRVDGGQRERKKYGNKEVNIKNHSITDKDGQPVSEANETRGEERHTRREIKGRERLHRAVQRDPLRDEQC